MKNKFSKIITRNFKKIPLFLKTNQFHIEQSHYALMGRLSTSILHDILSPLTSLTLATDIENSEKTRPIIEHSTKQIKDYVSIMRHFLSDFSHTTRTHINHEILQCITLLSHKSITHGVQIQFIEFDQIYAHIHPLHIYQIVINLVSNAIEASVDSKIKKVILILKKDKTNIYIECKDFGIGMNQETILKLGLYNFSTKSKQRGFGLYSTIYIIKYILHGNISIQSEPNKGSFFSCILPI